MGITTSELPRLDFTPHELFILHHAQQSRPLPADPYRVDALVRDRLIRRTAKRNVYALTDLGSLACVVFHSQIEHLLADSHCQPK